MSDASNTVGARSPLWTPAVRQGAMAALVLMFLVNSLNFLDRMLFSILQEPIKRDLALTDFQLGLLGGPAFAVLYSLLALPIGRLADRTDRVRVITIVTILWSVMTAMCGMAGSFGQMLLARLGVSVGEAGCAPAAHSIIAANFPPERRTGAIAFFTSGSSVGTLTAAFAGSALAALVGWRATFFLCGATGIFLAIVVRTMLREPARSKPAGANAASLVACARALGSKRSFRHLCAGMSLGTLAGFAITQYLTSFLIRVHGLSLSNAASITGLLKGALAFFVTIAMGLLIDWARRRSPSIGIMLPAAGLVLGGASYAAAFATPILPLALAFLVMGVTATHGYLAAGFAAAQELAPADMRSSASGLLMLIVGLIGFAIGSPLVGLVSDLTASHALAGAGQTLAGCAALAGNARCAAAEALGIRWGLLAVVPFMLWAGLHFWLASRTFAEDVKRG